MTQTFRDPKDLRRVISEWDIARLEKLGATVTDDVITATDEQLQHWYNPGRRSRLERGGQLIASGGVGNWIFASGAWNDAGFWVDSAVWID